jgi:nitrate reductase gamma subunit
MSITDVGMILPINHAIIDYAGFTVLGILIIEFVIEILRGKVRSYNIFPIKGPSVSEGKASASIKALAEVVAYDILASEPLAECHTGAYYSKKPHTKRSAHLLFLYGFIMMILSTISGFIFDKWVTQSAFLPSYYLGPAGEAIELGLGTLGGLLVLAGFIIYWPTRFRSESNSRITGTDVFILLLVFTVLTGLALEVAEIFYAYSVTAVFWAHISLVFLLFITMPYTKFSHALYQIIWNYYERYARRTGKQPKIPLPLGVS